MAIKRKRCMVEEEYSFWHLLPHDVLWMIIERLDFIDCHGVSAVCRNWRSGCKSYCTIKSCFGLPIKDTFPWLMMRKSRYSSVIKFYRPSTNKTCKIDMPEINGKDCLYSKDGWLLLHEMERKRKKYENLKLCLINLFTMDKIELPELRTNKQIFITKGTFLAKSNCPDCVIVMTGENKNGVTLYAWKKGSDKWKEKNVKSINALEPCNNIWSCNGLLYLFTEYGHCFAWDTDLNKIPRNWHMNRLDDYDEFYKITVCGNELFAFSTENNVYRFDRAVMDWFRVNDASSMILFKNAYNIGFMVKEECNKARSLLLNNLKKHGCQINPSTKVLYHTAVFENESYKLFQGEIYQYDRSTQNWVELDFNNLISFSEDIDIWEREKQMRAKEKLLVKELINGDRITTENFTVKVKKTGICNWVQVG